MYRSHGLTRARPSRVLFAGPLRPQQAVEWCVTQLNKQEGTKAKVRGWSVCVCATFVASNPYMLQQWDGDLCPKMTVDQSKNLPASRVGLVPVG